MKSKVFIIFLMVITLFACSKVQQTGSWTDDEFTGPINKVYIVGLAKSEMNRRVFESAFANELFKQGLSTVESYRDIDFSKQVNQDVVTQKMSEHGCDSVLLTKLINQRKETVTTPGRVSGYVPGPYYGGYGRYNYPSHYNSWGSYYGRPYDVIYEPPTSKEYVILTIESVLYYLESGK